MNGGHMKGNYLIPILALLIIGAFPIFIMGDANGDLEAGFDYSPNNPEVDEEVVFDASESDINRTDPRSPVTASTTARMESLEYPRTEIAPVLLLAALALLLGEWLIATRRS